MAYINLYNYIGSSQSTVSYTAIVGGFVSAVLVVILVVNAIAVLIFVWRKKRTQASVCSEPHTETHRMMDLTVDENRRPIHDHEMSHFNPVRAEIITITNVANYEANRLN